MILPRKEGWHMTMQPVPDEAADCGTVPLQFQAITDLRGVAGFANEPGQSNQPGGSITISKIDKDQRATLFLGDSDLIDSDPCSTIGLTFLSEGCD